MNFWKKLFRFTGNSPTKQLSAIEIGNTRISTRLNSIDRRRLRSPGKDKFRVILWHASQRGEIFVYASGDQSESTKPIGIIPSNHYGTIIPFLTRDDEYVSYKGTFNRLNEILELELSVTTKAAVEQERIEIEKEAIEHDERLQAEHREKLDRSYKLSKDLEQSVNLGSSEILKGKRKIDNLTLEFAPKEKYLNRHFTEAKLLEDGNFLCKIKLDNRVIRTYYSGYELKIKACKIERDRSFGSTITYLKPIIGLHEESGS